MKIVFRTKYINTFLVGFRSFLLFYPEKLKDVIIQVQRGWGTLAFKYLGKKLGIKVVVVKNKIIPKNEWASMLYSSLQYDEVVSFDDDIIFLSSGFFDQLENIQKRTNVKIIGTKYDTQNSNIDILHSHMIYCKNINITKEDFAPRKEVLKKYEGCDSALLGLNHKKEILYIDEILGYSKSLNNRSYCKNQFYIHIGGVSCIWHAIRDSICKLGILDPYLKSIKIT